MLEKEIVKKIGEKYNLSDKQSMEMYNQFIEEYLMGLIEFLRLYDNGNYASRILALLHKPRSHQP